MELTKGGDTSADLSNDLNVITAEINAYQRVAGEAIFEIGRRLHHVKYHPCEYGLPEGKDQAGNTIVARGAWGEWLADMDIPADTSQRFIKIYDELVKGKTVSGRYYELGVKALYEIAQIPETDREKPHAIPSTGETKTIDEMTVRELREVKKALKDAETRATQAEQRERMAQRDADILRDTLEAIEEREPEVRTEYVEVEAKPDDTRPYGVKLGDEIYAAFDELSEWQKKYSWILTDRDEFKLLAEANPDFAREFNRLDKFWRQLSDAFHSVESKGVYNSQAVKSADIIDGEFTEVIY